MDSDSEQILKPAYTISNKKKRWVYALLILLMAVCALLLAIGFFFEKKAKTIVLKSIQDRLKPGYVIQASDINLRVFKDFPFMAVECENLQILYNSVKKTDTLLSAQQILLGFSLLDLWSDTLKIKHIYISDARMILLTNKKNKALYDCLKPNDASGSTTLAVNKLAVKNFFIFWDNRFSGEQAAVTIKKIKTKGLLSATTSTLDLNGSLNLEYYKSQHISLKKKYFELELLLAKNNTRFEFIKSGLWCESVAFDLQGGFNYNNRLEDVSIKAQLKSKALADIMNWLPEPLRNKWGQFETDGNLVLRVNVNKTTNWHLFAEFDFSNGVWKHQKLPITIRQIQAKGKAEWKPDNWSIEVTDLQAKMENDSISLNGFYKKSLKEELQLQASSKIQLNKWFSFFPLDTITEIEGQLSTQMYLVAQRIRSKGVWQTLRNEGTCTWNKGRIVFKNDSNDWHDIGANIRFERSGIYLNDLHFKRKHSDLTLQGLVQLELNQWFYDTISSEIALTAQSNNFYFSDFVNSNSKTTAAPIAGKGHISWTCNNLMYEKNKIQALNMNLQFNPEQLQANFKMQVWKGALGLTVQRTSTSGGYRYVTQITADTLDVRTSMNNNNNWNQEVILSHQISGRLSGAIITQWYSDVSNVVLDTGLTVWAKTKIQKGQLLNYKPLEALSKFITLKDLKQVVFSDFDAEWEVKQSAISFHKTSLRNNALNLDFWGKQTFSDSLDYHVRLSLTEVLFNRIKNPVTRFLTRDKTRSFGTALRIQGTLDRPKISWDKDNTQSLNSSMDEPEQQKPRIIQSLIKQIKDSLRFQPKKTEHETLEFEIPKPKSKTKNSQTKESETETNVDDF